MCGIIGYVGRREAEPVLVEHQRRLLVGEMGVRDMAAELSQLPDLLEEAAAAVERSKAKDDARGPKILDDYAETRVAAAADECVRQAREEARRLGREAADLAGGWAAGVAVPPPR
jgi:hypothetical protein